MDKDQLNFYGLIDITNPDNLPDEVDVQQAEKLINEVRKQQETHVRRRSAEAIVKAAKLLGSKYQISKLLRIKNTNITRWTNGSGIIPVTRAFELADALQGKVEVEELRPDLEYYLQNYLLRKTSNNR